MNLRAFGCSFRTTPVELRERLAFDADQQARALAELVARYGGEAVLIGTCNRVELYLAGGLPLDADLIAEFLGEFHRVPPEAVRPHLYVHADAEAVQHLFRVAASLDSLIVGEGQIAGQVKQAYEFARERETAGPFLHHLFQHARVVAKRVRRETGIARGNVSVSSVAVAFVKEVFAHFGDKTVLVIGAGKMGALTLRHLRELRPQRILVTNRSPDKAAAVAAECGGVPLPWEQLDDALAHADIVLSTTGAPEPIVTRDRYERIAARRAGGRVVILDIAVPRDFDPRVHDGDQTFLFNIDDLTQVREQTLAERAKYVEPAEAIVRAEAQRFVAEWTRRRNGPVIARLTQECDAKREAVVKPLLARLNGRLTEADRKDIEAAFRRLQSQLLHGPISALTEATPQDEGGSLLEALRKLFRLRE